MDDLILSERKQAAADLAASHAGPTHLDRAGARAGQINRLVDLSHRVDRTRAG